MRSGISAMEICEDVARRYAISGTASFSPEATCFCLLASVSQLSAINYQHHVPFGSFTFEVIGGSLRTPSSRRRSKSSEIFA